MAVEIKITIQDQHIDRVLEALTGLAEKPLKVVINDSDLHGSWAFRYASKAADEPDKDFAVRVIKENVKAMIRVHDLAVDRKRYDNELAVVAGPAQNIPDDILT